MQEHPPVFPRSPGADNNPNPVFRASEGGMLLAANEATRPLLDGWRVSADGCLPPPWPDRIAAVLVSVETGQWDEPCGERCFRLQCVPDGPRAVTVFAFDITDLSPSRDDLARRTAELEALLQLLPVGIAISYDTQGVDIRVNPANARLLGVAPEANVSLGSAEARVQPPYRVFDEAGHEVPVEQLPVQVALRGAEVRDDVIEIVRADGSRVTLLSYATPLPDATGNPRGAVAAFVDITALRHSEVERERLLTELEARHRELEAQAQEIQALNVGLEQRIEQRTAELEAIFASAPDALYVVMNQQGVVRANRAALESLGASSLEDVAATADAIVAVMQARDANTGEPIPPGELVVVRALAGEHAVQETLSRNPKTGQEQIYRSAAAPIVVDGRIVGAVGIATDITTEKRTQQQLAYQAELLESVDEAILAADLQLRVTAWNRRSEEQYGWTAEEAMGQPAPLVTGSRLGEAQRGEMLQSLRETGRWSGEIPHSRRDGTPIIVEGNLMALRDAAGRVYGYVAVNRDITQRKAIEEQNARLLQEVRARGEQLRALSRRLVTMQEAERSYVADQLYNQAGQVLAALQLQLARLRQDGGPDAASPGDLATIRATLSEAMRELHDLASELRPVGLDRYPLARVLESYALTFGKAHQLAVRFDAGGTDSLQVPADVGTAVFRSIQEGLANVTRHAQASEISLSLARDDDRLVVSLADNGVGFEPKSSPSGTPSGLGLASVRERLETVGGQLSIYSGKAGTTLTLKAPLGSEVQALH